MASRVPERLTFSIFRHPVAWHSVPVVEEHVVSVAGMRPMAHSKTPAWAVVNIHIVPPLSESRHWKEVQALIVDAILNRTGLRAKGVTIGKVE